MGRSVQRRNRRRTLIRVLIFVIVALAAGALAGLVNKLDDPLLIIAVGGLAGLLAAVAPIVLESSAHKLHNERWQLATDPYPAPGSVRDAVIDGAGGRISARPGFILRPEVEAVGFMELEGREIREWARWAKRRGPARIGVIYGPSGSGKTRLLRAIASDLSGDGIEVFLARGGLEVQAAESACALNKRVVLLIEYADAILDISRVFSTTLRNVNEGAKRSLCVIMTARTLGLWWRRVKLDLDGILLHRMEIVTRTHELRPIRCEDARAATEHRSLYLKSLADLCDFLALNPGSPSREYRSLRLETTPLGIEAAALLDTLAAQDDLANSRISDDVFSDLLLFEQRYWRRTAKFHSIELDDASQAQVLALVSLLGPKTVVELAEVIRRCPQLTVASDAAIHGIVGWVRDLFPVNESTTSRQVQPTMLAYRLLVDCFCDPYSDYYMWDGFEHLPYEQESRALKTLGWAALTYPQASLAITRIYEVSRDPLRAIETGIRWAAVIGGRLDLITAQRIAELSVSPDTLSRLHATLEQANPGMLNIAREISLLGRRALGDGRQS